MCLRPIYFVVWGDFRLDVTRELHLRRKYIYIKPLTGSFVGLVYLELLDFLHIYFLGGGDSVISLLSFSINI